MGCPVPGKRSGCPDLPHGAAVDGHCGILHSGSGGAGPVPIQASEGTGVFSAVSDGADPLGSGDHSGSGGKFRLERPFPPGILYRHGSGRYSAVCRPDRGCAGVSRAAAPFPASDAGVSCSDADSPQPCTGGGAAFGYGLLSGHTDGNVCPGLRRCPADAVSLCHHHWLPCMGGPAGHVRAVFSGERVFLPVPVCPDLRCAFYSGLHGLRLPPVCPAI